MVRNAVVGICNTPERIVIRDRLPVTTEHDRATPAGHGDGNPARRLPSPVDVVAGVGNVVGWPSKAASNRSGRAMEISTELRAVLEYVPGHTRAYGMTDSELQRELQNATGERRDALEAEIAERAPSRTNKARATR
jgi:hypothetical protein